MLTALIALALFSDHPELVADADKTWGVASRELLGPGLTGLMLACLLAALMSSIDAYMVVGSALVVRNIYAPYINPNATDKQYLSIGRWTGVIVVGGAVIISLTMMDVFKQLQLTWIFPVVLAAPFWIGMFWRRATSCSRRRQKRRRTQRLLVMAPWNRASAMPAPWNHTPSDRATQPERSG